MIRWISNWSNYLRKICTLICHQKTQLSLAMFFSRKKKKIFNVDKLFRFFCMWSMQFRTNVCWILSYKALRYSILNYLLLIGVWISLCFLHIPIGKFPVHGMEYGYGAHDFPISGVFEVEPKSCPGFIYRCSVPLGRIKMPPSEFQAFLENVASEYHGDTYHLISKNCNHFTDDIAQRLTGKGIPGWVNRLARVGMYIWSTKFIFV